MPNRHPKTSTPLPDAEARQAITSVVCCSSKIRALHRTRRVVATVVTLACIPAAALACIPDPDVEYDTAEEAAAVILRATVEAFSVTPHFDDGSCQTVEYRTLENLHGSAPATFTISRCETGILVDDYADADPDDLEFFADVLGYVTGAKVLGGIIVEADTEPRHLVPNCWGPLHLRLDTVGEAERTEVLDLIRQMTSD